MTRLLLTLLVAQSAPQLPNTPFLAPSDTMHATVSGRGEPVVLVPGLLGSGFAFRKVVHLLNEAGFRTVVVDLLGTGRSTRSRAADYSLEAQAGRIAFVLDTLGVTNARVVAHAIGGSIVMRMTLQRPDLVSALLLLLEAGPAESAATDGLRKALKFGPLIKLLGAGPVKGRMRDQMVEASGDPSWVEADVVEGYARGTVEDLGATLDVFRAMSSAREPEALAPRLAEIREPVRLLLGGSPHSGGPSSGEVELLRDSLSNFAADTLWGIGHFPHEEAPTLVRDAVLGMLGDRDRLAVIDGPGVP